MPRRPASLTGKQRRHLRALAHPLRPIVQIGHGGLSAGVTKEIRRALETHELLKVKLDADQSEHAEQLAPQIESGAECHVVQHIGRTLVLYCQREKDPTIQLPKARKRAAVKEA